MGCLILEEEDDTDVAIDIDIDIDDDTAGKRRNGAKAEAIPEVDVADADGRRSPPPLRILSSSAT
jgi:hypothetical protein